jgi:hypothetical protein
MENVMALVEKVRQTAYAIHVYHGAWTSRKGL